jgi:hypothetical protein
MDVEPPSMSPLEPLVLAAVTRSFTPLGTVAF